MLDTSPQRPAKTGKRGGEKIRTSWDLDPPGETSWVFRTGMGGGGLELGGAAMTGITGMDA
jgi:hypothetical protein